MVVVSPISSGYGAPMATMVNYVIWTCTSKWKRQRPLKWYVTTLQSLVMFYLFCGSSKSNEWGLTGLLPTCQTYNIVQFLDGHLQSMTFLGRVHFGEDFDEDPRWAMWFRPPFRKYIIPRASPCTPGVRSCQSHTFHRDMGATMGYHAPWFLPKSGVHNHHWRVIYWWVKIDETQSRKSLPGHGWPGEIPNLEQTQLSIKMGTKVTKGMKPHHSRHRSRFSKSVRLCSFW
jgi:hypothetical protein